MTEGSKTVGSVCTSGSEYAGDASTRAMRNSQMRSCLPTGCTTSVLNIRSTPTAAEEHDLKSQEATSTNSIRSDQNSGLAPGLSSLA